MENGTHEANERRSVRRWRGAFTWTGLLVVGWALYELTTQPALGAVAVCLKFGWEDFRTARWLRRRDPDRRRGRACFWLYVGNGLWKTAAVAFVILFAMVVAVRVAAQRRGQAPRQDWMEDVGVGTVSTLSAALTASAVATLWALWLARRYGIRLWLHSSVHRACWADAWPPHEYAAGRRNRMGCLRLTVAMVVSLLGTVGLTLVGLAGVIAAARNAAVGTALFWLLVSIAGPVLLLWALDQLDWNVRARSPWECWGGADVAARDTLWLADLPPDRITSGTPGRFLFFADSRPTEVDGRMVIAATGPPDVLRTVQFAPGETAEGLDLRRPIVVEGVLVVIRHPARGEFPAVVELQVREARRGR